jgi:hypothetical protein
LIPCEVALLSVNRSSFENNYRFADFKGYPAENPGIAKNHGNPGGLFPGSRNGSGMFAPAGNEWETQSEY